MQDQIVSGHIKLSLISGISPLEERRVEHSCLVAHVFDFDPAFSRVGLSGTCSDGAIDAGLCDDQRPWGHDDAVVADRSTGDHSRIHVRACLLPRGPEPDPERHPAWRRAAWLLHDSGIPRSRAHLCWSGLSKSDQRKQRHTADSAVHRCAGGVDAGLLHRGCLHHTGQRGLPPRVL